MLRSSRRLRLHFFQVNDNVKVRCAFDYKEINGTSLHRSCFRKTVLTVQFMDSYNGGASITGWPQGVMKVCMSAIIYVACSVDLQINIYIYMYVCMVQII